MPFARIAPRLLSGIIFFAAAVPLLAQQGAGRGAPSFWDALVRPRPLAMLILGLLAMVLLLTKTMRNGIKVPFLLLSTFLFGIAANLPVDAFKVFSMHPSPICAITKPLIFGFRVPMFALGAVILFLTLVGPKLFCGWVCPVGAAQELIAMLADKLRIRRIKWNFTFTQAVRIAVFLLFVFLSMTAVHHVVRDGNKIAVSVYDSVNAFHGFKIEPHPSFWAGFLNYLPFILTIALAFKTYRPYCYLVCPIGLFTNALEQVSLFRVSLNKSACTDCKDCVEKSPCPTVPEILKGSVLRPDCFSCTVCVNSCRDSKALSFGVKRSG
jgi:ferredoxin-type protein NapH